MISSASPADWPPAPPLVAILRGLQPERAAEVADVLFDAGWRLLEVPLNRPGALQCIATIAQRLPQGAIVGAGTVQTVDEVEQVAGAGGRLIVSPHTDVQVIARSRALNLYSVPGVFTASEAFAALRAGAHVLKLFPAEAMSPVGLRALLSVLPAGTQMWPVGGIEPADLGRWRAHGASGFGIGGALFKPEFSTAEIARRAQAFVQALGAAA